MMEGQLHLLDFTLRLCRGICTLAASRKEQVFDAWWKAEISSGREGEVNLGLASL